MDISLDLNDFEPRHASLAYASKDVSALRFDLEARISRSRAMDEFEDNVMRIKKIVRRYANLLESDCYALFDAAMQVVDADSTAAMQYRNRLEGIRDEDPKPAKKEPFVPVDKPKPDSGAAASGRHFGA